MHEPDGALAERLPHAPPARLVTSARLDPEGLACTAVRETAGTDPMANAEGFFPDCLLVELMAQTAGLVLPRESHGAYVAGLRAIRFHSPARAGEALQARAHLERRMGPLFLFDCRAESAGKLLASGSIALRAF